MIARDAAGARTAEKVVPAVPDDGVHKRGRAAWLLGLQHTAGNAAVTTLLSRQPTTPTAVQGEQDGAQQGSGSQAQAPLLDRYRAALASRDWEQAAVLLNGFSDDDIKARVSDTAELPPPSRTLLREHTPEWNNRVRRALLIADYNDAKAAGQWATAATLLNGFNDPDIQLLASQLGPDEVGPMVHGAIEAMHGVSLDRVLRGVSERYAALSPDPAGTKALTMIGLMQAAGTAIDGVRAYLELKLDISVSSGSTPGQASPSDDHQSDINVLTASIMGSSSRVGAPGAVNAPGAPSPLQPPHLEEGNLAHSLIGDYYVALNPPSVSDQSASDILSYAKGRVPGLSKAIGGAKADLFTNLDMRPDITDLGKLQIFEIKPVGSTALAVLEAAEYVALFDSLGISEISFTLGNPGNRGTRGIIPGPDEILVWASPLPGAIVYTYVRPPESPQRAQERIESGAYESGTGVGVEAITGLGLAAVAAVAALPTVSAEVFESYPSVIRIVTAATRAAGQPVPTLIPQR